MNAERGRADRETEESIGADPRRAGMPFVFESEDRTWLAARYVDDGWGIARIARERGCVYQTVASALHRFGIPRRQRWVRGSVEGEIRVV